MAEILRCRYAAAQCLKSVNIHFNHGAKHSLKKIDVKSWPNTGKAENPALSPGPSLEHFGKYFSGSNPIKFNKGGISPLKQRLLRRMKSVLESSSIGFSGSEPDF